MLAAAGLLDHQQVFFLLKSKRRIPVFAKMEGRGQFFFQQSGSDQEGYIIILPGKFPVETERSVSSHFNYKDSNTTAESALVVHDHSMSQVAGGRVGGHRGNSLDLSWTAAESRFWSPHQSSCRSGGDPLRPTRNRPWSVNQTALTWNPDWWHYISEVRFVFCTESAQRFIRQTHSKLGISRLVHSWEYLHLAA